MSPAPKSANFLTTGYSSKPGPAMDSSNRPGDVGFDLSRLILAQIFDNNNRFSDRFPINWRGGYFLNETISKPDRKLFDQSELAFFFMLRERRFVRRTADPIMRLPIEASLGN
jgi:hypothetical protein